jgi:archaeal flagellin N-terminal-like domain
MKEIFMPLEKKEKAVSPVIATILMVAITVVLAATVYILVGHYTSVGTATPLTASLTVDNEGIGHPAGKTVYYYNLTITLSTPVNITNLANVHITANGIQVVLPQNSYNSLSETASNVANTGGNTIEYLVSNTNGVLENTYIQSGSTITIVSNINLSGDTVSLTYAGYSGTVSTTLP